MTTQQAIVVFLAFTTTTTTSSWGLFVWCVLSTRLFFLSKNYLFFLICIPPSLVPIVMVVTPVIVFPSAVACGHNQSTYTSSPPPKHRKVVGCSCSSIIQKTKLLNYIVCQILLAPAIAIHTSFPWATSRSCPQQEANSHVSLFANPSRKMPLALEGFCGLQPLPFCTVPPPTDFRIRLLPPLLWSGVLCWPLYSSTLWSLMLAFWLKWVELSQRLKWPLHRQLVLFANVHLRLVDPSSLQHHDSLEQFPKQIYVSIVNRNTMPRKQPTMSISQ